MRHHRYIRTGNIYIKKSRYIHCTIILPPPPPPFLPTPHCGLCAVCAYRSPLCIASAVHASSIAGPRELKCRERVGVGAPLRRVRLSVMSGVEFQPFEHVAVLHIDLRLQLPLMFMPLALRALVRRDVESVWVSVPRCRRVCPCWSVMAGVECRPFEHVAVPAH
jgi:hypothetical protein